MSSTLPDNPIDLRCPFCGSDTAVLTQPTHRASRNCPFHFCPDCDHKWDVARTQEGDRNGRVCSLPLTSAGKISCWVDEHGCVYAEAGNNNRDNYLKYELDLETRKSVRISRSQDPLLAQDWSAGEFLNRCAGTPEKLMRLARNGVFDKMALTKLLRPDKRQGYLQACATIEKALTEACTAKREPCLEEGCAVEGEICLEACLAAGATYPEACAAAWIDLFVNPENRIAAWRS